ncbi:MAG TPA: hypothetical protein VF656_01980 [Pyrinomonadaceae bacterium]|jgi:hypothetical protein
MREIEAERERELNKADDARWYVVYVAALVSTVLVILALWFFSRWFSS